MTTKELIIKRADEVMDMLGDFYWNCHIFVQLVTGIHRIHKLKKTKVPKVGDIIVFHEYDYNNPCHFWHYGIFLGNGKMINVHRWGQMVYEIEKIEDNQHANEKITFFKVPQNAYAHKNICNKKAVWKDWLKQYDSWSAYYTENEGHPYYDGEKNELVEGTKKTKFYRK